MSQTDASRTDDSHPSDVADDLAKALGMTGPMPRPDDARARPPEDGEALDLDKDGTLRSVEKLDPVRAHRSDDGADTPTPETKAQPPSGRKPKKAKLPPKLSLVPKVPPAEPAAPSDDAPEIPARLAEMVGIPAGPFLFGEEQETVEVPAFSIDRFPVTNRQYEVFVRAAGHRTPLYWPGGQLPDELRDHPVVGVDYFDALAYARWCDKDLPFEDEWERAARGTDGRTFPWGDETDLNAANTARGGLKVTIPVGTSKENVSPDGLVDTVGNCWEITHSPAPGGGIIVRGGSWFDFALYAKTWFRFGTRPDARNGTIGFRCVRRDAERDAEREVDPEQIEAEILARTGAQPPVDTTAFASEKRDLVLDLRRLRALHADLGLEPEAASERPAPVEVKPARKRPKPPAERLVDPEAYARTSAEPKKLGARTGSAASGPASDEAAEPSLAEPPLDRARRHVPDPDLVPESPSARPPVETTDVREAEPASEETLLRTRQGMWGLAALAFLLVAGLVGVLVDRAASEGRPSAASAPDVGDPLDGPSALDPEPVADPLGALPGAPPASAGAVFDVAEVETRLAEGVWLLVFVDPDAAAGPASLDAAREVVARVAGTGAHAAIVVPFEGDETFDVDVIIDPEGRLRAAHQVRSDTAAVLLQAGTLEMLTQPPVDLGFSRQSLAPIAVAAADLAK